MARAGSLAKLVQQGTNVLARSAAGPAAQLASEATSSCSSRGSAVLINVQRREGSSLTTTSYDSVSAVTKSLLLDTLGLVCLNWHISLDLRRVTGGVCVGMFGSFLA